MKDCLIIGAVLATTYDEVVELFKDKTFKRGYNTIYYYTDESGDLIRAGECFWYSTISNYTLKDLNPNIRYSPENYQIYDDYPAIEVNHFKHFPVDYNGLIGVPTSAILRRNIIGKYKIVAGPMRPKCNGKTKFPRLIIKKV
jgi:hypothetical protein